jgi:prepilin-type N-terminal cleavage/methylation domain-containing protein
MKHLPHSIRAFTLIELLVVISIIAILAALALPAITGALARGQLSQSLSNSRQIYTATFAMAMDSVSTGDTNIGWPADIGSSWQNWATALVEGKYLATNDFNKMLSAPGAVRPPETAISSSTPSGLAIFNVSDTNASTTVFITTANYLSAGQALDPNAKPFGDKGFVTLRKGGDANVYQARQATNTQLIPQTDFVSQLQ